MLDLKNNDILQMFKEQMVQEVKVEVKNIDEGKQIKQVKIEINTNDENLHSNIDKGVVINKTNYNRPEIKPQRREIWYVDLGKRNGSCQSYKRPFLITSNPVNNRYSTTVNGFPITSQVNSKADIPVHVKINGCGLKEESLVLAEQITTIDIRYDLRDYVGTVDELLMKKVDKARNIQLGDMQRKNTLERLDIEMQKYIINNFKMINTYEITIETMKINNVSSEAIDLIEDQKFREENGLKCYCDDNRLSYDILYNDYKNMMKDKEEDVAL